uniref:Uncharacterized protein n=1 Tax=Chromera velia CCMP2878 TaxID=1169474 RepID=A0A0G4GXW8_9ALVE|eukprot:Cvel_23849.t1-p1 / transcript=Cvel_23849.t1 / gene=Cvel_23849 / organism=Chromera_velia_CCMP2878 / gene_product=hypothetical protein / transcript_product=hypothetical protein / location=Cvel_scaffold2509:323-1974(+) / protein_length=265 / sequence_SO=supercontig / SO=protein_coding / is_pseudo=false
MPGRTTGQVKNQHYSTLRRRERISKMMSSLDVVNGRKPRIAPSVLEKLGIVSSNSRNSDPGPRTAPSPPVTSTSTQAESDSLSTGMEEENRRKKRRVHSEQQHRNLPSPSLSSRKLASHELHGMPKDSHFSKPLNSRVSKALSGHPPKPLSSRTSKLHHSLPLKVQHGVPVRVKNGLPQKVQRSLPLRAHHSLPSKPQYSLPSKEQHSSSHFMESHRSSHQTPIPSEAAGEFDFDDLPREIFEERHFKIGIKDQAPLWCTRSEKG